MTDKTDKKHLKIIEATKKGVTPFKPTPPAAEPTPAPEPQSEPKSARIQVLLTPTELENFKQKLDPRRRETVSNKVREILLDAGWFEPMLSKGWYDTDEKDR